MCEGSLSGARLGCHSIFYVFYDQYLYIPHWLLVTALRGRNNLSGHRQPLPGFSSKFGRIVKGVIHKITKISILAENTII